MKLEFKIETIKNGRNIKNAERLMLQKANKILNDLIDEIRKSNIDGLKYELTRN